MIKYRVKGEFLSEAGVTQSICSGFFFNNDNPFEARKQARKYLLNFKDLLINDFQINFEKTFKKKVEIKTKNEIFDHEFLFGIALEFTLDEKEFYIIDYYGMFQNDLYDYVTLSLQTEIDYYKTNNKFFPGSKIITYYNKGEFEEGYTEDEPQKYEVLETSLDLSNKECEYWWLNEEEYNKILSEKRDNDDVKKSMLYGENNFIEFKPTLLYNFKTQQASISIKNIIAKVICSFLNSNGGKLLIGVNDKGEIQGLDFDFSLKTKENEFDFFRNEFENLLYQFFDKNIYNYIRGDFNTDFEKTFFEITIKPSDYPVFLRNKKNNTKEFYIRTITSSIQIHDVEEVVKYCLSHWQK